MTDENLPAARRLANSGRIERTGDRQRLDVRPSRPVEIVDRTPDISLQPAGMRGLRFLYKCNSHGVGAGFDRDAKSQSRLNSISGLRRLLKQRFEILASTDRGGMNPLSINRKLDIMSGLKTTDDIQIRPIQLRLKHVIPVDWEIMDDPCATDSAQRHSVDVLIL